MDNFSIVLDPLIAEDKTVVFTEEELTAFGWGHIWNLTAHLECNLIYRVGEESFLYWPTPLPSVLSDLIQELADVRSGTSHDMTICAYGVLAVEYSNEMAYFFDLSEGKKIQVGNGCSKIQVEAELIRNVNLVWTKIRTFL